MTNSFFFQFGVYRVLEKSSSYVFFSFKTKPLIWLACSENGNVIGLTPSRTDIAISRPVNAQLRNMPGSDCGRFEEDSFFLSLFWLLHLDLTWTRNSWSWTRTSDSAKVDLTTALVTWTILMMSLLPFWVLDVVVMLRSMQGQKALRFHQNILICVQKMNKNRTGLERHEGEQLIAEFTFLNLKKMLLLSLR